MTSSMPPRIVRVSESNLKEHFGGWTEILKSLLLALSCATDIPVKIYSYFDGNILAKYRVAIELPEELDMSIIMPYGEAQSSALAFDIAVVEAITSIREYKCDELKGTIFAVIPFGDIEDRVTYDYITFVKEDPESAAQCMERCMDLAAQFFDLYENMSTEVETLLSVYTDPESVVTRREMLESEAQKTRYGFSINTVKNPNLVEPKVESPETPLYRPMSPNYTNIPCNGGVFADNSFLDKPFEWEPWMEDQIPTDGYFVSCDSEEGRHEGDEYDDSFECYLITREEFEAGRGDRVGYVLDIVDDVDNRDHIYLAVRG